VIPIQRRGYALYSPAPINRLTISTFNQIRADEPTSKDSDWLATSLCYAAFTGTHPEISLPPGQTAHPELSLSFPPTLEVAAGGESTVRFVDVATGRQPREWALTFDSDGRLLKVSDFLSPAFPVTPLPETSAQTPAPQSLH
jgi:hypothetical protein